MGRSDHAYDDWYDEAGTWRDDHTGTDRRLEMVRTPDVRVGLVVPHEFGDAQTIADRVRRDELALVDLRECNPALAARLTDFCSGLAYALDGGLQVVADGVLLVSPGYVDVSGDEASAVREPGFFNRL
jgi:cell division inhibitor SepF